MELLGGRGLVSDSYGLLSGDLESLYREAQFHITVGGTNDVQRDIAWSSGPGVAEAVVYGPSESA